MVFDRFWAGSGRMAFPIPAVPRLKQD